MKKLLVLSLVLGIASLATAGLDLTGSSDSVKVVGDDASYTTYTRFLVVTGASISDWTVNYAGAGTAVTDFSGNAGYISAMQGKLAAISSDAITHLFKLEIKDTDTAEIDIANGDVITFGASGTGWAYLSDDSSGNFSLESAVAQIPEPATMALLGLGALVLRRKK